MLVRPALTTLLLAFAAVTPLRTTGSDAVPAEEADSGGRAVTTPDVRASGEGWAADVSVSDPDLSPLRRGDAQAGSTVDPAAPFEVRIDGELVALRVMAVPVLPGEDLHVTTPAGATFRHQVGRAGGAAAGGWRWRAPVRPGAYALRIEHRGEVVDLTVLVMHPAEAVEDGRLGGYAIGDYVQTPLRGDPAYLPPKGFVEVAGEDADLLVSPRLTVGQFLCKQPGDPRFVVVSPPLLVKLEAVLDRIALEGWDPAAMVVMSGFRTPAYNRAIGNTTVYSRHLWGDAADIYLDADGDGVMDDLDGDGRSGDGDAFRLAELVDEIATVHDHVLPGGLATYRANAVRGPFVHVDARGHRARW